MRKVISILILSVILVSCGGTSEVVKQSRKTLKGYWNLDNINYNNATGIYDVTLFGDVSSECMVGSTWRFIPNNNFGNYEITSTTCNPGKRYFVWSIPDQENAISYDILLKPTDEKMNSIMNDAGFRLNINYLSENELTFTQTVQVDGKPFKIVMNFSKISE
ncbi:lipocalin family protein [Leeuwenhoekiella nanhaiensis]|uniref:Lipocalin n=1 Tax=Leeuwenhoekiella nanhaiensis TaxID=1655491 RepID=A0A2G1VQX5_9FLAO|nr:lipocalin family protein [Leeuwenhoekiella nanhaiensis]PHQ29177.1 lipocalin [Leeuwenhoekiella nanhaiensis]